ncbi:AbrB family transcriptional regulator [Alteribacillus sp. YIM 98480]|uniref:AbrB family transcriptional regulator n=1 Tax=Alteribacillus sp. YIM 98480 TaxID=2606599 RepID=UPI00131AD83A|nr:AbrB family transcriptional regulator [Alteribacillus sp. YIM 98480]
MRYVLLVVIAATGGLVGLFTGHPIGPLLGSLLSVGLFQLLTKLLPPIPLHSKRLIQAIIGGSIGLSFTYETIQQFVFLLIPIIIIPLLQLVFTLLNAFLLNKWLKIDAVTALCSSAPAGMSEMAIISEKYGANIPTVATFHLFRIIFIVNVIPIVLTLF